MKAEPHINWRRLGWRLRSALNDSGASLRDFERITGVDHTTLQRLTTDKPVRAEVMLAVCEVLEIDPMSLFTAASERAEEAVQ